MMILEAGGGIPEYVSRLVKTSDTVSSGHCSHGWILAQSVVLGKILGMVSWKR